MLILWNTLNAVQCNQNLMYWPMNRGWLLWGARKLLSLAIIIRDRRKETGGSGRERHCDKRGSLLWCGGRLNECWPCTLQLWTFYISSVVGMNRSHSSEISKRIVLVFFLVGARLNICSRSNLHCWVSWAMRKKLFICFLLNQLIMFRMLKIELQLSLSGWYLFISPTWVNFVDNDCDKKNNRLQTFFTNES